jgi:hypothetical protein
MTVTKKSLELRDLLALIVFVWAASAALLFNYEERGSFGDMFGAINSLFSGLAFATLIYTAWMQRKELSLQRTELALTRTELKGQRAELALQNSTSALQRFENTFFELLRVHGQIIAAINISDEGGTVTHSRNCFRVFYIRLKRKISSRILNPIDPVKPIQSAYKDFYGDHQEEIGHYFRHLYHVVKFVKNSDIEDKKQYTNFVRAQLSSFELTLIFYNGISEMGNEKFKPLIEEFSLLKNLPTKLLVDPKNHLSFYSAKAYE